MTSTSWSSWTGYISRPVLVLADGSLININHSLSPNCAFGEGENTSPGEEEKCADLRIDVNGPKGPNTWGIDIYGVNLLRNRLDPWGPEEGANTACYRSGSKLQKGFTCAAYVLANVDY